MNLTIAIIGALLVYLAYKITPFPAYFSYSDTVVGLPRDITIATFWVRLLIPFFVSTFLGLALRFFQLEVQIEARIGTGLLFGLFVVVPQVFNPELIPPRVREENKLRELYSLYLTTGASELLTRTCE